MNDDNTEPTPILSHPHWMGARRLLSRFPRDHRNPARGHYEVVDCAPTDPASGSRWLEIVLVTPGFAPFIYRLAGVQVGELENAVREYRDVARTHAVSRGTPRGKVAP